MSADAKSAMRVRSAASAHLLRSPIFPAAVALSRAVRTKDEATAIANAHAWFEVNSGWAPPDPDEMAEWLEDGVCRCPDDCMVRPDGWCRHGLASWWLVLRAIEGEGSAGR